jgi:hypothetical protein
MLDLAAQVGRGGAGKLTSQSPEEARFNLVMGYANVALAGLDVGLEVGAVQKLAKVTGELAATGVNLTRQQWVDGLKAAQQSPARLKTFLASLKDIPTAARTKLEKAMLPAVQGLDNATTQIAMNADGTVSQSGPLNQTRQNMEARVAASETTSASKAIRVGENLSDEAAEQLLAKYPQWENVKEFVSKRLDPNHLPPGYKYRVKNGQPELYRDSTEGPFPPLTVKDGVVMLQTGQSTRLSVFSRYKKNYLEWVEQTQGKAALTAAQKRLADGNQLHHLTPDAVVQDNELTRQLMTRSKTYTLDRGRNILDMPTVHDPKTGKIVHLGSHKKFNDYVDGLLDQKIDKLTGDGAIPLEKVKVEDIDKAVRQVEDLLRDQITNHTLPKNVLKELEGGGFGISKGIKDPQEGEIA